MSFPALKTERGVPMFKDGIIFTTMRDKAEVFFAVLKKLDQYTLAVQTQAFRPVGALDEVEI